MRVEQGAVIKLKFPLYRFRNASCENGYSRTMGRVRRNPITAIRQNQNPPLGILLKL